MDDVSLNRWAAKAQIKSYYVAVAGLVLLAYSTIFPSAQPLQSAANSGLKILGPVVTWLPVVLIVLGVVAGGVLHLAAARQQRHDDGSKKARRLTTTPYPTVRVFRHKEARKHNDDVFHKIVGLFTDAGWRVEPSPTDLIQHENGIRIYGKAGYEREAAKWALDNLGIKWIPDERKNPPEILEVIVGRYEEPAATATEAGHESLKIEVARCHDEVARVQNVLNETQEDRERIRGLLGTAEENLRQCRMDKGVLLLYKEGQKYMRENEPVSVTVRFIDWNRDAEFADHVGNLFRRHPGWATKVERDLGSDLRRGDRSRIIFESGNREIVVKLADIFNQSGLVGEPVQAWEIIDAPTSPITVTVTIFPNAAIS